MSTLFIFEFVALFLATIGMVFGPSKYRPYFGCAVASLLGFLTMEFSNISPIKSKPPFIGYLWIPALMIPGALAVSVYRSRKEVGP